MPRNTWVCKAHFVKMPCQLCKDVSSRYCLTRKDPDLERTVRNQFGVPLTEIREIVLISAACS